MDWSGLLQLISDHPVLTAVMVVVLLVMYLWDVWRRPDVSCLPCRGKGQILGDSRILGRLVGGTCWFCRGNPWRMRRIARWLGWTRHSRVGS